MSVLERATRQTYRSPTFTSPEGLVLSRDARLPLMAHEMAHENVELGYRGASACAAAGISYRQLDYWARTGLVQPTVRGAAGSGSSRLYGFKDILVLKIVKRLLDTGVSLQNIRSAVTHLRERGVDDLARITLMSDGASIYECTNSEEIFDLLQGGQGVFGIAIGKVWNEVEGSLSHLQAENVEDGSSVTQDSTSDELAARRKLRGA